ncbi:Fe-S cluster assembly protein SufD [Elioraea rosea]|uniref:Fe-S cluster assembly protein SufD n=1 Tax=Elioraea rosea TaxID=2492390 RepID=UPI001181DE25|nr:Fe-S cluster assembly protein SufD [Elioraea rosea]
MASSSRQPEMAVPVMDGAVREMGGAPMPLVHPSVAAMLELRRAEEGPEWLATLRDRAAEAFARLGFPTRRNEAWHYTDLRSLAELRFAAPERGGAARLPDGVADAGAPRLVFVDGAFRPDLSDLDSLPDGVRVESLSSLLAMGGGEGRLGALADAESGTFVALNTMLADDGAVITCTAAPEAAARLHLVSVGRGGGERPVAFHPRHLIHIAEGAELTLFDSALGEGAYLNNTVAEITLGKAARMTHVRLQAEAATGFQVSTVFAHVAEEAEYDSFVLATGARLARNEVHATLAGPKAVAHLNGAQLGDGARHVDTTTVLTHAAPNCASRQTFKSVLSGASRAVFQGKIHVHQVAQKTDGYQMNQALLLSPTAEIDAKPQLEIYADDVKCSHGATVGELDADQLFYLRSRGLPLAEARAMLIEAFLADALEAVRDETLRAALAAATAAWWARAHAEAGA